MLFVQAAGIAINIVIPCGTQDVENDARHANEDGDSFEGGGGTLPEYSSREGCRVEVQDSRDGAAREFGRLAIHRIHIGIALWSLSVWVAACVLYIGIPF